MNAALGVRFLPDFLAAFFRAAGRLADFLADFFADFLVFLLAAIACLPSESENCVPRILRGTTETNSTQPARIYNRETAIFPRKRAILAAFSLGSDRFGPIFPRRRPIFPRTEGVGFARQAVRISLGSGLMPRRETSSHGPVGRLAGTRRDYLPSGCVDAWLTLAPATRSDPCPVSPATPRPPFSPSRCSSLRWSPRTRPRCARPTTAASSWPAASVLRWSPPT